MIQQQHYPSWQELVAYSEKGPQPKVLMETNTYKSVIAGLEAGGKMPAHAEGTAIFHFLEGKGQMLVGEESYSVQAGSTVVVPDGANRGIEAETRMAFLAVRLG